jgi:hypothetical protein
MQRPHPPAPTRTAGQPSAGVRRSEADSQHHSRPRHQAELFVYFEFYDPAQQAATKKPRVVAAVSFYRQGRKAFESAPVQLSTLSTTRQGTLPVQFQIPLNTLKPGRYTCQLSVIDETAKKFEFLRAPMVVLP